MSVLESLINRIKHQNQIKKIIVATTRLKRDDEIESICKKKILYVSGVMKVIW